jgi:excisionase family DNA binding protein
MTTQRRPLHPPAPVESAPAESAPPDPAELLTVPEAARLLGVSRQAILAAVARGRRGRAGLPAVRVGARRLLIRRGDLIAYSARRRPWFSPHAGASPREPGGPA